MFKHEKVGAVIVAAGSSTRMGGVDKIFALLDGKPVLTRAVSVFETTPSVDCIAIVLNEANLERGRLLSLTEGWQKVVALVPGGALRQDSVRAGLSHLSDCRWLIIHDGARPLVTSELIDTGLEAAETTGAAAATVAVTDTIKEEKSGFITRTPPRETLRAAQTPQVFRADILSEAYKYATGAVTDDASLVEAQGHPVKTYPGDDHNLKITTPDDLIYAEIIWRRRGC